MAALTLIHRDPTLAALESLLIQQGSSDTPRPYLGASQLGDACARKVWYGFHWVLPRTFSVSSYRAIQDGHRGEAVMIEGLRKIPGVQLWTEDPEHPGQQIGFVDLAGHFRGHVDGVIEGLLQAPKTPHVWEAKVCNETKVRKLQKLIVEQGEKQALDLWDEVYFAQAQIYMHYLGLTRHYLTAATPGVRDIVSCRTEYQPKAAKRLISLAKDIITGTRPPLKLSENAAWYQCKWCDYAPVCHGNAIPEVNCRTCAHSTAQIDDSAPWKCELHQRVIPVREQRTGCPSHAFHPDLLANSADPINADPKTGVLTYRRKVDSSEFKNGITGTRSRALRDQSLEKTTAVSIEETVMVDVATDMGIPPERLQSGELSDEQDFPALIQTVKRLSTLWEGDDRRLSALRTLIENVDCAYTRLAERVQIK